MPRPTRRGLVGCAFGAVLVASCTEVRGGCDRGQVLAGDMCRDPLPGAPDAARLDVPTPDVTSPDVAAPDAAACPEGFALCDGFCRDTRTDEGHCGRCGQRCAASQVCGNGVCTTVSGCAEPRRMCGAACLDTSSDNAHCGACGVACPAGSTCSASRCACPPGQTLCAGSCVTVATDRSHCGACGNACTATQACAAARCVGNAAGGACRRHADCPNGTCATAAQGFPEGYCYYECGAGAREGDECASGSGLCLLEDSGVMTCLPRCRVGASGECRAGYVCLAVEEGQPVGYCYPHCAANPAVVCGALRCNAASGECEGDPCTGSASCSMGSVCNLGAQQCQCSSRTHCGAFHRCYPAGGGLPARCGCATDAACPTDSRCNTRTGVCE